MADLLDSLNAASLDRWFDKVKGVLREHLISNSGQTAIQVVVHTQTGQRQLILVSRTTYMTSNIIDVEFSEVKLWDPNPKPDVDKPEDPNAPKPEIV